MEHQTDATLNQVCQPDPTGDGDDEASGQATNTKGDKGALWLLVGVVALAAITLWMIRDIWTSKPVVVQSETPVSVAATAATAGAAHPHLSAEQASAGKIKAAQDQIDALRRQKEESLLAARKQAAHNDQQRREAEQQLEEERAARAALEQQQLEAEKQLAKERAALEQARIAAEKQLESERLALKKARLAAEARLASERAERAALERRAALEKQKMLEAQAQVERAERESALASEALQAEQARLKEAVSYESVTAAEQITPETPQNDMGEQRTETAAVTQSDADTSVDLMEGKFSSNPCEGPSAKFLSTCR